jgi:hypothetical protein
MPRKTVHIESLHVRVPTMTRTQATSFGEQVARGLEQGFGKQQISEQIGFVNLRFAAPENARTDGLAAMVAERILLGLRR